MSEKTINFGDKKINKKDFYNNKKQFNIKDIDINKILIFKPESLENDGTRKMSFLTDNNEFLERYTAIWEKISDLLNKKFDSDPVYNNKYINTKI